MVHGRAAADPVSLFLKRSTFRCKPLNAALTPEECVTRQLSEVETKMFGRKITTNNAPQDRFCRSGCCAQGLIFLRKLRYSAWVTRMKEKKKAATPCKPKRDDAGIPVNPATY